MELYLNFWGSTLRVNPDKMGPVEVRGRNVHTESLSLEDQILERDEIEGIVVEIYSRKLKGFIFL